MSTGICGAGLGAKGKVTHRGVIRYPDRSSQYSVHDLALAAAMCGLRRSIGFTGICILTGAERSRNLLQQLII